MPGRPNSLFSLGANLLTARTAFKLRWSRGSAGAQQRAFHKIVRGLAATAFWRQAGVEAGMGYEDFRTRVVPRTYESLRPAIERMRDGERDVLWPGACAFFAQSAGTSDGAKRLVPVTPPMLRHFRQGCRDALLYYSARTGHAGVFHGQHLVLSGSMTLQPLQEGQANRAFAGEWPAVAALSLPSWLDACLYRPGAEVAALVDWESKIEALAAQTAKTDVALLAGVPPWVLAFADRLRAQRPGTLQDIWPNLECVVHGGMSVDPYRAELKAAVGKGVALHEVYAAAEGVFAAQDTGSDGQMRVIDDAGLFFEFIPLAEYDEAQLETAGFKAVRLAEVGAGVDYVVLLTTPAGLARYVLGDIVRFASTAPARLQVVGRVRHQLRAFGERIQEKDVSDILITVCNRHRWSIAQFHVAPLPARTLTGGARGRHEWWVELRPGTKETPTGPQMGAELENELQRLNPDYAALRTAGRIDPPVVRLVMPGVFRHWLQFHDKWGGQNKMPRCRNDRLIADQLAQLTRFAGDEG